MHSRACNTGSGIRSSLRVPLRQKVDTLYAPMSVRSHLLPARSPWLYRLGDLVRLPTGEVVQILDGFLHVRRNVGSWKSWDIPAGSQVLIIASACEEGSSL